MTPRPNRLALLISLMGIGLSATGPAWADEEADRAAARDADARVECPSVSGTG